MFIKTTISTVSLLIATALPATATMGGSGSHGNGACGQGNHMQENMNEMMGSGGMGNSGYHHGQGNDAYLSTENGRYGGMNQEMAETMAMQYMQNRNSGLWDFGTRIDNGSYYSAEIMGPNGELLERLLIDKQSGNVHSLGIYK